MWRSAISTAVSFPTAARRSRCKASSSALDATRRSRRLRLLHLPLAKTLLDLLTLFRRCVPPALPKLFAPLRWELLESFVVLPQLLLLFRPQRTKLLVTISNARTALLGEALPVIKPFSRLGLLLGRH